MPRLLPILISALCFVLGASAPATPQIPAPGSAPVPIYDVLATRTNSGVITKFVKVEKRVYLEPTTTTIRLKFMDELTGNPISIDYTAPRQQAFVGWEIIQDGKSIPGQTPTNAPAAGPQGVGLPLETIALPEVTGDHQIVIWSHEGQQVLGSHPYDLSGTYSYQVPAWDRWYWLGLWSVDAEEYVYEKWIGHFLSD